MKKMKSVIVVILFSLPLMSCVDEPAQPKSTNEIISEISGSWSCSENESGFPLSFNAEIKPGNTGSQIFIYNFHNTGNDTKIYATVFEDLTLEIPEQITGNQIYKGTGIISDDFTEISWTYTIEDENGDISDVTGKYTYSSTL